MNSSMHNQPTDPVQDRVTALVASILAGNDIQRSFTPEEQFTDMGLTSVDMVNLMLGIEAEFDVTIPQEEIVPEHFTSVATAVKLVKKIMHGTAQSRPT